LTHQIHNPLKFVARKDQTVSKIWGTVRLVFD
jgi:hypothetical protein